MKKIFNILIITFLVLNMPIICVHSDTVNLIEEKLESIDYDKSDLKDEEIAKDIHNFLYSLN